MTAVAVPTALLMARPARLEGLPAGSRRDQAGFVRAPEATGLRRVVDRRHHLTEAADPFRGRESARQLDKTSLER